MPAFVPNDGAPNLALPATLVLHVWKPLHFPDNSLPLKPVGKVLKDGFYALVFDALHPISFLPINSRSSSSVNRHALPLPVSTTPRLSANLTMPDAGMLIGGFVAAST